MKAHPERTKKGYSAVASSWLPPRNLAFAMFLAVALILLQSSSALPDSGNGLPHVLHVAFSSRVFSDVDRNDAQIAMELWAKELSRKAGIPQARVTIFQNTSEIVAQVQHGDIHLVTLPAMELIAHRTTMKVVPAYIAANKCGKDMENLLIVRSDSGLKSIHDLKGKSIGMLPANKNEASRLWLNLLLLKESRGLPSNFPVRIKETPKPAQALMGVFFKQFNGAVITRGSYETCRTLNPQLAHDLTIIAESASLAGDISCLPHNISPQLKQAMDRAAISLHESTVGKQIATLFQIDRVIPFKPNYLAGLEELLQERDRLTSKRSKRK